MAKQSKEESDKQRFIRRVQREQSAPTIGERYPKVEQLLIMREFSDDSGNNPSPANTITLDPSKKLVFEYECHQKRNCIDGGYDFTQAVNNALEAGEEEFSGEGICSGSQWPIGSFACHCTLKYKVKATYR